MATEVRVPIQGNDVESCVLTDVHVRVGDEVTAGQIVFSIETAKASYEVEAPESGVVLATSGSPGDEVPVHTTIVLLGTPGEAVPGTATSGAAPVAPAEEPVGQAVGTAPPLVEALAGSRAAGDAAAGTGDGGSPSVPTAGSVARHPVAASPRARLLAERNGLSLHEVVGTGPRGRVIAGDIVAQLRRAADRAAGVQGERRPAPAPLQTAATPAGTPGVTVVPVTGVRKIIAERMGASLRESAQFTLTATVDARPLQALRARLKVSDERWGLRSVTVTDIVAFAAVRTLAWHPALNAHFAWDGIRRYDAVALGLAVDTPRGLLVTVTQGAERMRLPELAAANRRLVDSARAGTAPAEHLSGATFTVSSLGAAGIQFFTPVINPPEVAILGVGAIAPAVVPTADGGEIAPALHLSLTVDHRAVDGAPAAAYVRDLGVALRDIESLVAG